MIGQRLKSIIGLLAIILAIRGLSTSEQTVKLKTYHDPQYGVSFQYPTAWTADPKMGFYLLTNILIRPNGFLDDALMKVGLKGPMNPDHLDHGPYSGTNLDGIEFVYTVLPQTKAESCYERLKYDGVDEDNHKQTNVVIHGVEFTRVIGGDAGLGHGADRDMYGAYRGGRCYLFEAGIHTWNGGDPKFMASKQINKLRAQLTAVMRSVKIEGQK